ncbi:MAG: hypothetical protein WCL28_08670 [bacterium]
MKKSIILGVLLLAGAFCAGCIKAKDPTISGYNSSKITSVKMQVPSKIGPIDITGKITGYSLQVKKTGGSCDYTDLDRTEKIGELDVKIDAKLKQECDYAITLSFGNIGQDGQTLEKVYLTSDAYDSKPARPALVKKEELKGKAEITIKACVSVTTLGAQNLGVNAADCPSVTDNSIAVIPQPAPASVISQTFKLSKSMTGTAEGYEVFFSGEILSAAASTKYCAIAIDAYYDATTPALVIFDEAFIEVKPGEKLTLNKSITVDVGPLSGPLSFSELRVMEQCLDKKPGATAKASDAFAKCYPGKICPVIKP